MHAINTNNRSLIKLSIALSAAIIAFMCGAAVYAGAVDGGKTREDMVWLKDSNLGLWSPPATMREWSNAHPTGAYAIADVSFPQGNIHYGAHGETTPMMTIGTNPGVRWPEIVGPFPIQGSEHLRARWDMMRKVFGPGLEGEPGAYPLTCNWAATAACVSAQMEAEIEQSPELACDRAKEEQNQGNQTCADTNATMTRQNAGSAIDYVAHYLYNFTVDGGNKWNIVRDQLFLPMAILILLPGAVLTQVKAIASAGNPVIGQDIASPFEGLLRAIVAIFLIPGTYLFINYGIDIANSITYTIASEYTRIFGTDMYKDAMSAEVRAFPVKDVSENKGYVPNQVAQMGRLLNGPDTPFAQFEGNNIEIKIEDPVAGIYIDPEDRANEMVPYEVNSQRNVYNTANAGIAVSWNIMCAFQQAYLYYLWFAGPVVAALWVYPMRQLREAFPNWVQGVAVVCFWSLFWNTVILLMACWRGVDETGTLMMSALNFLATASVKTAFDFAGLAKQAGAQAMQMAQSATHGSKGASGGQGQTGKSGSNGSALAGAYGHGASALAMPGAAASGAAGSHALGSTVSTAGSAAGEAASAAAAALPLLSALSAKGAEGIRSVAPVDVSSPPLHANVGAGGALHGGINAASFGHGSGGTSGGTGDNTGDSTTITDLPDNINLSTNSAVLGADGKLAAFNGINIDNGNQLHSHNLNAPHLSLSALHNLMTNGSGAAAMAAQIAAANGAFISGGTGSGSQFVSASDIANNNLPTDVADNLSSYDVDNNIDFGDTTMVAGSGAFGASAIAVDLPTGAPPLATSGVVPTGGSSGQGQDSLPPLTSSNTGGSSTTDAAAAAREGQQQAAAAHAAERQSAAQAAAAAAAQTHQTSFSQTNGDQIVNQGREAVQAAQQQAMQAGQAQASQAQQTAMQAAQQHAAQAQQTAIQQATAAANAAAAAHTGGAQSAASHLVPGGAAGNDVTNVLANDFVNLLDPTKGIVPGSGSTTVDGGSNAAAINGGLSSIMSAPINTSSPSVSGTFVDQDNNITLVGGIPQSASSSGASGSGAGAASGGTLFGGSNKSGETAGSTSFGKFLADGFHKADQRFTNEFSGQNADKMKHQVHGAVEHPASGHGSSVHPATGAPAHKDGVSAPDAARHGQHPSTVHGAGAILPPPPAGHAAGERSSSTVSQTGAGTGGVAGSSAGPGSVSGAGNLVVGGAPADALKQNMADEMVKLLDPTKGIVPNGTDTETSSTSSVLSSALGPSASFALGSSGTAGTTSGAPPAGGTVVDIDSDTHITLASGLPAIPGAASGATQAAGGNATTSQVPGGNAAASSSASTGGLAAGGAVSGAAAAEQNSFARQLAEGFHKADQRFVSEFSGQNVGNMQNMVQRAVENPNSGNVMGVPGVGGPVLGKDGGNTSTSATAREAHQTAHGAGSVVQPPTTGNAGIASSREIGGQSPSAPSVATGGAQNAQQSAHANVAGTAASGASSLVQGGAPDNAIKQAMANDMVDLLNPTKGIVPNGAGSESVTTGGSTGGISPTGTTAYAYNASGSTASDAGSASLTIVDSDTNITLDSGLPPVSGAGAANIQAASTNGSAAASSSVPAGGVTQGNGTTSAVGGSGSASTGGLMAGGAVSGAAAAESNSFAKHLADGFHKADQRFVSEFSGQNADKMQKMVQGAVDNPHSGNVMGVPGVGGPVLSKDNSLSASGAGREGHQLGHSPVNTGSAGHTHGQPSETAHHVPPHHVPPHSSVPATHHAQQPTGGTVAGHPAGTHLVQNAGASAATGAGHLVQGGAPADAMKQALAGDMVNLLDPTKGIVPKGSGSEQGIQNAATSSTAGTASYALSSSGNTASGAASVSPTIVDSDTNITLASGLPPVSGAGATNVQTSGANDSTTTSATASTSGGALASAAPSAAGSTTNGGAISSGTTSGASTAAPTGGLVAGGAVSGTAAAESNSFAKHMADGFNKADQRFVSEFSGQNVGNMQKMVQGAIENPNSGNVIGVPGVGGPVLSKESSVSGSGTAREAHQLPPTHGTGAVGHVPASNGSVGHQSHVASGSQPSGTVHSVPPQSSAPTIHHAQQPAGGSVAGYPSGTHLAQASAGAAASSGAGHLIQGGAPADAMKQALAGDMVNLLDPTKGIVPKGANSEPGATGGATAGVSPAGTTAYALNSSGSTASGAGSVSPTIVDSDTNITLASGLPPVSGANANNLQTSGATGSTTTPATASTAGSTLASTAPSAAGNTTNGGAIISGTTSGATSASTGGLVAGGAVSGAAAAESNSFAKHMAEGFHKADQRFTSEFSGQNTDKMQKMVQGAIENPNSGNVMGVPGVGGPVLSKDSNLSGSGTVREAHQLPPVHGTGAVGHVPASNGSVGHQSHVASGSQPSGTVHNVPPHSGSHAASNVQPHSGAPTTHHAQQPAAGTVAGHPSGTHLAQASAGAAAASGAGHLVQGGAPADAMKQALAGDMVNLLDPTKGIVPKSGSEQSTINGATSTSSPAGTTAYAFSSSGGTTSGAAPVGGTVIDSDTNITLASGLPPVSGASANNVQSPGANGSTITSTTASTAGSTANGATVVSGNTSTASSSASTGGMVAGGAISGAAAADSNSFAKHLAEGFHKADQRFASEFSGQNVGNMQKMVQEAVDNPRSGNVMGVPGVGGPVLNKADAGSTASGADRVLPQAGVQQSQIGAQPPQTGVQQPQTADSRTQSEPTTADSSASSRFSSPATGSVPPASAAFHGVAPRSEQTGTTAEMMFKKAAEDMVNLLDPTKNIVPSQSSDSEKGSSAPSVSIPTTGNIGSTPITGNAGSTPADRGNTPPPGSSVLSQALSLGLPNGNVTPSGSMPTTGKIIADGLYNKGVEHAERFASQNMAGMADQVRSAVENPHSQQAREQTENPRAGSAIPGGSVPSTGSDLKMAPPASAKQDEAQKPAANVSDGVREELTKQAVDGVVDQLDPVKGIVPVFGPVEGSRGDQASESLAKASQALSAADKASAAAAGIDSEEKRTSGSAVPAAPGGTTTARVEQNVWQERITETAGAPAPMVPIPAVRPTGTSDPLRFGILNADRKQALESIEKSPKNSAKINGNADAKDTRRSPKSTSKNTTTKAKKVSSALDRALKGGSTQKPSAQPPATEKKRVKDPMAGVPHDNTSRRYRSKRKVTSAEWAAMEKLAPDAKSSAPKPDEQA
jgi:DNA-binding protein Fis